MKAIRVHQLGEPEVMKLEEVPDLSPGAGQVVVRIHAAGVNPVDAHIRSGAYGQAPLPYTPGSDAAGTAEKIGGDISGIAVGDRVYVGGTLSGAYAEQALCEPSQVHRLPDRISFAQGAAINVPYGTAYRALFQRAHALAGDTILVHGASGGVGIAAVQLACAAGMTVIGTAGSDKGRQLAAEQGCQHVLDHRDPNHFEQALALTGARGVDIIIELAAHANLGADLSALAPQGRVAVIGSRGPVQINPGEAMGREASIVGVTFRAALGRELAGVHAALIAGLENGTLRPVVGQEIPLAEAPRAHRAVMEGPAYGKIVLLP